MHVRLLRLFVASLAIALLAACAAKPASTEKPLLRKLALIPATEPQALTLRNENGALAVLVPISTVFTMLDSKQKARLFNEKLAARQKELAPMLTSTVVNALRAAGYQVDVLDDIKRDPDDPDSFDLQQVKTDAEMIVQLRIDEVGVYSGKLSPDYVPRVNIQAKLHVRSLDDALFDENLYFGVDAKKGDPLTVVSDPKFTYASFDDVMARTDELGVCSTAG